ncbi:leucine-rich repeat-containing protein 72 isoform X1 [Amia ocellicauda]|uniref:leucine-rich repeat-containing protein 72 isoform X1 n=1 Tax=Amia ocellicauda TaxID=2972642 RepID=UPI003464A110
MCEKAIEDILKKHGITRAIDVSELYLAKKALASVADLSRFPMMTYLWLNDNKIREVCCLRHNYRLTELYLHNNDITSITGCLRHLTSLQVLLLHNNQLKKLGESVSELRRMHFLRTLTFFLNPFAQDPGYRLYVIHYLPSVTLLDRREIKQEDRRAAFNLFNPERNLVLQSLAFGRRAEATPIAKTSSNTRKKRDPHSYGGRYSSRRQQHISPTEGPCDSSSTRSVQRSVMQFSSMDWETVPTSQQRHLEDQPGPHPRIITVQFR